MGHLEGITFLDSRGDGRYLISNGKDQTIKLWDIRKMSSSGNWYVQFQAFHRNYEILLLFTLTSYIIALGYSYNVIVMLT